MRWLVEVSSLGKTDLQKFCVEAESWQRALQAARAQRGEEGPMSGFSIELLEEGYRAVDPLARVRFVVKRAPDDTPITAPLAKEAKGGVAPSPPSAAPPATSTTAATVATEPKLPPSPASSSPATKSVPPRPMSADKSTNGPASKKGLTFNAEDASSKAPAHAAPPAAKTAAPAATTAPATAKPAAPAAPAASAAQVPVGSALPGLPAVKLLSSREQDPTEASPLTYREYSFAVPAGTSEDVAVAVLRGQLKLVDAHLTGAKMGKLVNLAVFDVEFTGKPPSPPIATLSWKDWKGDPVIGYPRRGGVQKQVKPPSGPPAAGPQSSAAPASAVFPPPSVPASGVPRPVATAATTSAAPPAAPAPAAAAAPVAAAPAPVMAAPVPPQASPAQSASAAPVAAPQPAPVAGFQNTFPASPSSIPPPNPLVSTAPMIPQAQLPQQAPVHPASGPPPAHASGPPPAMSASQPPAVGAGGIPVPVVAPVAVFQPAPPGSIPPPAPAAVASVPPPAPAAVASVPPPAPAAVASVPPPAPAAVASVPPPAPAAIASVPPPAIAQAPATSEPPPPRRSSPDGMVRTPSGRFVRGRTTGDELITALFESMHDLHFLRDALDGGQFCLALATEVLPARAAIIHFFDVEKREWIIACTRGKDTSRLLTLRTPESDELLRDAARKRRAIVAPNGTPSTAQRYQSLGGARSMIIAPIMQAGRALGAIEIINPLDGMPFTEDEGNAMTYIAEQYAEYLGSRGIVVDSQRIQNAATPR